MHEREALNERREALLLHEREALMNADCNIVSRRLRRFGASRGPPATVR
jgi:hypothetical protein